MLGDDLNKDENVVVSGSNDQFDVDNVQRKEDEQRKLSQ